MRYVLLTNLNYVNDALVFAVLSLLCGAGAFISSRIITRDTHTPLEIERRKVNPRRGRWDAKLVDYPPETIEAILRAVSGVMTLVGVAYLAVWFWQM